MDGAKRFDGKTVVFGAVAALFPMRTKPRNGANGTCGIAIMAKASAPGRAKTRLVPPLSYDEAADLNTAFLKDVADNVLLAARDVSLTVGIAGYAAYGPPGSEQFFRRNLPGSIDLIEAWFVNFGDCLWQAIREIFARGNTAAVVLNSDSPDLPTALLSETAEVLARPGDRAVLGPSNDGGYYLLGLKAAHHRMFEDISWSTERVAEQTRERAHSINLDVHVLPEWYDVDDIESLRRLYTELCRSEPIRRPDARRPHRPKHTAALLHRLWSDGDFRRRIEGFSQIERTDGQIAGSTGKAIQG